MKFLYDLFPLLLFFAAFYVFDIYVATAVAMVASIAQVAHFRWKHGRFETMHLVTLAAIMIFGSLTLLLHDSTFIKWKPTIVYWVLTTLMLATQWGRGKTAFERLLGAQMQLPRPVWRKMNLSWAIFFLVLGVLNLYVAFWFGLDMAEATRDKIWVNFKVWGTLVLTFLFIVGQSFLLARHLPDQTPPTSR